MLRLLGHIPKTHFHVACSGGSDSMVLVDFLRRFPHNDFDILHFNHGTECCDEAEDFVRSYCSRNGLSVHVGRIRSDRAHDESREEYWRRNRYGFLSGFSDEPILMAHHLNDCAETWIMTSVSGRPSLIPYHNARYNVYRPFLSVPKSDIEAWARHHGVSNVYDASNSDTSIHRNYVRHVMMPNVLKLNPGFLTTMRRKVVDSFQSRRSDIRNGAVRPTKREWE